MALFGRKKVNEINDNMQSDRCSAKYNEDGKIQIEYIENPKIHRLYDITRLIIDSKEENPFSDNIYNCRVSYYGTDDVNISSDESSSEFARKNQYKKVKIGLDMDKINEGEKLYYKALMVALLDEDRVIKYLSRGMQEEPDIKCGDYIGEIKEDSNGIYKKIFDSKIGNYFHRKYSYMRERIISDNRAENQQRIEKAISEKQSQIESLQREIEALKKEKENLYIDDEDNNNFEKPYFNLEKSENELKDYYNKDIK